jgi:hypothetical protein
MAVATITTLLGNQGDPIEYTVATGIAIPKGSLMNLDSSPQTATIAGADGEFFCGIAATEKTATDGVVKMSCITHCIAEMTAGVGATTFGQPQKIGASANVVIDADDDNVEKCAEVVGISLETVADGDRGAVLVNC